MTKGQIISIKEMYELDAAAISMGVSGIKLMENAGKAVTKEILKRWSPCDVTILCGTGNNGGDGFVIARLLEESGYTVKVALWGSIKQLKEDAAFAAKKWPGNTESLNLDSLNNTNIIIDAIFGAGLNRNLSKPLMTIIEKVNTLDVPCISVDIPSGVHGDSGQVLGLAIQADLCVTFSRYKAAHLLLPGRALSSETIIVDIGIPKSLLLRLSSDLLVNTPANWLMNYPWPKGNDHKYTRGHALVIGGDAINSGAPRLGAKGALRIGAGLVTILAPKSELRIYASQLTAIMLGCTQDLKSHLDDQRKNAILVGPGLGLGALTRKIVIDVLKSGKTCVLDADALTSFKNHSELLFNSIHSKVILTPHQGEFVALFGSNNQNIINKVDLARKAAERSGAVIIYKGPDTVVASPDGRTVINNNASPNLATAGSGDVLAGFVLGLVAQGMEIFEASSAGVWLHGAVSKCLGPGLISEDLADALPRQLRRLECLNDAID